MSVREGARVIVIAGGSVLFAKYELPGKPPFWVVPGGGLEPGESFQSCALRELREETGIDVRELGAWVWLRSVVIEHEGKPTVFVERYFVVELETRPTVRNSSPEAINELRWWSIPEIRANDQIFFPMGCAHLLAPIVAGRYPETPLELRS